MSELPEFRRIFDEHAAFVWRSLRYLGVAERDVEDHVQEVFVAVHRRLGEFEWRSSLRTWIYAFCLRVASDYRRRAHVRRERFPSEFPEPQLNPNQERQVEHREMRDRLVAALEQLDDAKREVFVLYEIEELEMKDVVALVGCPLQTGYSRLRAARKILEESLQIAPQPHESEAEVAAESSRKEGA
ncbi:MAG: sigma-70 family RNA polymerase sigma factor [Polyangiaceae bacterium]|nr:sigma-70 family RNA polymerase sigma factor [Myxococcales bacterium]MCB9585383.1 sigma-70 family RNA polymerase sigma factor [Polyangiaceae bacterium]MCB9606602.1 sigma-70 family RNA polymerase sigma factor [Polyangiaceae bacterium]